MNIFVRHRLVFGFLAASVLALPARLLTGANVWTIPGIANSAGQNGTRFVSDVAVTNPGTSPASLYVRFAPAGSLEPQVSVLDPGATVVWRNVLGTLWGGTGSGLLSVSSDQKLILRARTYNTAATGTYGVALPVYEDDRFLLAGETADSLWVTQGADLKTGYRTNVAVLFPDEKGGAATVTVFDAAGNEIGKRDFSLDAAGVQQIGAGTFSAAVAAGRARIDVTRGPAAGYTVVVDNVTGDSSLFTFDELPAGYQDVLVSGVARANGKNGTFFRTDGRFYNPASADATITASFHALGNSNSSPVSRDVTIPAGKVLDVTDVLSSLLGLPVGSSGALRFRSESPVGILCRTSNVDPSGAKPGTFGAQQKPVPLLSFLMSADAGALITGVNQNSSYRTNVGFAAGKEGATYDLTLKTAQGVTVAAATRSLGPFGWEQPGIDKILSPVPDDAQVFVKVTLGSVDVYDSSVDNVSGDSVVTAAATLPAEIPSSATIGPQGGSVRSEDGRFTLKVPAGALAAPAAFRLLAVANTAPNGHGSAYLLSPGTAAFARPALVVQLYEKATISARPPLGPRLAFQSGGSWYAVTGSSVDATARTVTAGIPATTPATAVRSGRLVEGETSTTWSSVYAVDLIPPARVVLTGDSLDLRVSIVDIKAGDPNPYVLIRNKDLSTYSFDWYANTVLSGNGLVGTIVDSGATATYQAPAKDSHVACIPVENPVLIQVFFAEGAVAGPKTDFLRARIGVLARDWSFYYGLERNVTCTNLPIPSPISFGYGSQVNARFSIGEDLKVGSLQKAGSELLRTEAGVCYGDCAYTMGPVRYIDIVDLEGSSFVNAADPYEPLHLKFLFQDPGDPSFTIYCPMTPVVVKPEPPATVDAREFRVPLGGGQTPTATSGFSFNTETVRALPLTPTCQ